MTVGLNSSELYGELRSPNTVLTSYQNRNVGSSCMPLPAFGESKSPPAVTSLTRRRMSQLSHPVVPQVTSRRTSSEIQVGKWGRPETAAQAAPFQ